MPEDGRPIVDIPSQWRNRVLDTLCACAVEIARRDASRADEDMRKMTIGLSDALRAIAENPAAANTETARPGMTATTPRAWWRRS